MFLLRDGPGHEDAEVTRALVQQSDDDLAARLDLVGRAVDIGDPVEGLLRRRDVVAHRSEQHDRRTNLAQVEDLARARRRLTAPQLVADEEVLRDPLDLFAVHQVKATPPPLELEKARNLGVDLAVDVVVLVPESVGRIQVLEVLHQVGAVEEARTHVGGHRRHPGAAQHAAGIAHRVVARAVFPAAAPVGHRRAVDHDGTGVLGVRGREHHCRPAALAVADDRGLRALRVQLAHALDEAALGRADVEQCLARLGLREENHEIDRMALAQRDADLRIVLEAADARPVAGARIDDHVRPALRINRHSGRRHDANQRVIDCALQRAPVEHHLVVEGEHRRHAGACVFDVLVASLAHRVQEQDAALH